MAKRGFTLIELLVVIAIIGILATLTLNSLGGTRAKARDVVRKNDFTQMRTALELYANDNGVYPSFSGTGGGDYWNDTYPSAFTGSINGAKPFYPNYINSVVKPPLATDRYYYVTNSSGNQDLTLGCAGNAIKSGTANANSQYVIETKLESPANTASPYLSMRSIGGLQEVGSSTKCTGIN